MEQKHQYTKIENDQFSFKKNIGILLITLGIVGVIWIVYSVLNLFELAGENPTNVPIIGILLKYYEIENTIHLPNGDIVLPKAFYFIIGLFLYLFIIRIVEGITKTLLSTGSNLLESELNTVAKKLKKELSNLKGMISRNK